MNEPTQPVLLGAVLLGAVLLEFPGVVSHGAPGLAGAVIGCAAAGPCSLDGLVGAPASVGMWLLL